MSTTFARPPSAKNVGRLSGPPSSDSEGMWTPRLVRKTIPKKAEAWRRAGRTFAIHIQKKSLSSSGLGGASGVKGEAARDLEITEGRKPTSADEPSFQEGLHVATSVHDAVDDDVGAHDAVDHAPRLMMQFPVFGEPDTLQLFRNVSAGGELCEIGAGGFDFLQDALCRFSAVATGDEPVKILDVAFRVLGEKNTVRRTGCRPDVCEYGRRIRQQAAACPPRPAGW